MSLIDSQSTQSDSRIDKGPSSRLTEASMLNKSAEKKKKKKSRDSSALVTPPVAGKSDSSEKQTSGEKSKRKPKKDNPDTQPLLPVGGQTALDDIAEHKKGRKRKHHHETVNDTDGDKPRKRTKAKRDKHGESELHAQPSTTSAEDASVFPPPVSVAISSADSAVAPDSSEKEKGGKKLKKKSSNGDKVGPQPAFVEQEVVATVESLRKEKGSEKSKKRSKKDNFDTQPGSVEQTAVDIDTTVENKKDRKRKRHHENTSDTNTEKPNSPKKEKKEKRIKGNESESHSQPSISTPAIPSGAITPNHSAAASAFLAKHSITIHTPPSLSPVVPIVSFDQLQVPEALKVAFKDFEEPTPIQACAWPPALQGHDVVGIAETGSGKTLAFGIPALSRLASAQSPDPAKKKSNSTHTVSVLVLAPTRELALQTHDALSTLGAPFDIASVAVFGGVDKAPQIKALKNGNKDGKTTRIVVGTPGRILDLVNEGACDLSRVNYLVLDEADRMLDKGFENDIRKIISYTMQGADRQTMMFSATWPEAVRRLASLFQRDAVRVTVGSDDLTANSRVEQTVEVLDDPWEKDARLEKTLKMLSHKKTSTKGSPDARILVFALYKKEASRVESMLRRQGYSVGALHGDMSQSARMAALEKFKTGETGLLVATDVAARGLDIPNVGAVINYTFPLTIEDYIHRIGRTGRGGRSGKSITFFTGEAHERGLAGELARVLRDSHFDAMADRLQKFPMTIKKKTHSSYGAFFRDDVAGTATKIVFD